MLKQARQIIIQHLWEKYNAALPQVAQIQSALQEISRTARVDPSRRRYAPPQGERNNFITVRSEEARSLCTQQKFLAVRPEEARSLCTQQKFLAVRPEEARSLCTQQKFLAVRPEEARSAVSKGLHYEQLITLDHFAVIDLPGTNSGIPYLTQLFSLLGYTVRGQDYLASKQNDFVWMAEVDSTSLPARDVLPQVVVADFRLDELPLEIRRIISKYAEQAPPVPLTDLHIYATRSAAGDSHAMQQLHTFCMRYLNGRDWPLPTTREFYTVREFNELLAWVLVFGRRPNHFTFSIHLLDHFASLDDFLLFIENDVQLALNYEGGRIKGSRAMGIAQGSTVGTLRTAFLQDGSVTLPGDFIEFVWRFPLAAANEKPIMWNDFFTHFIKQNADDVIKSLYVN